MKLDNKLVRCPICLNPLAFEVDLCNDCAQWGKDNNIDLLKRLHEDDEDYNYRKDHPNPSDNMINKYSPVLRRLADD